MTTLTLMILCWRIVTGPARMFYTHLDEMWFHLGPALIGSFLLLPLVIVDVLQVSNRFAGPLIRLRRGMRKLARGEHVDPIHFRNNDFWQEFADEFNAVAAQLDKMSQGARQNSSSSDSATTDAEQNETPRTEDGATTRTESSSLVEAG